MYQTPELIIADEIYDLIFTDKDCTPLFVPFIHRKMRRNSEGEKILCKSCNIEISGVKEGKPDCPYCAGIGYMWDESIQQGFFYNQTFLKGKRNTGSPSPVGKSEVSLGALVTNRDLFLDIEDAVYSLMLDRNKYIKMPMQRLYRYNVYFANRLTSNQTDSEFNVAGLSQ